MFLMSSLYGSGNGDTHANAVIAHAESVQATAQERSLTGTGTQDIEAYLQKEFFDTPVLIEVARCESEMRQFNKDGSVLRGRAVSDDIGVMQINEFFHGDTAKKMGMDIYTTEGNVAYAKYLYSKYGLKPWSASKPCWGKHADLARK